MLFLLSFSVAVSSHFLMFFYCHILIYCHFKRLLGWIVFVFLSSSYFWFFANIGDTGGRGGVDYAYHLILGFFKKHLPRQFLAQFRQYPLPRQ